HTGFASTYPARRCCGASGARAGAAASATARRGRRSRPQATKTTRADVSRVLPRPRGTAPPARRQRFFFQRLGRLATGEHQRDLFAGLGGIQLALELGNLLL